MRLKLFLGTVIALTIILGATPGSAQERTSCSVVVRGLEPGSRVNMRSGPGVEFDSRGYVLVGQEVTLLSNNVRRSVDGRFLGRPEQRRDRNGVIWYLVEYLESRTRGWIRGDFIGDPDCGTIGSTDSLLNAAANTADH